MIDVDVMSFLKKYIRVTPIGAATGDRPCRWEVRRTEASSSTVGTRRFCDTVLPPTVRATVPGASGVDVTSVVVVRGTGLRVSVLGGRGFHE